MFRIFIIRLVDDDRRHHPTAIVGHVRAFVGNNDHIRHPLEEQGRARVMANILFCRAPGESITRYVGRPVGNTLLFQHL